MRNLFYCKLSAGLFFILLMTSTQAHGPDNRWQLRITNPANQVVVRATVRLKSEAAQGSCMGGAWKRVIVESKSVQNEKFFPLEEPLAYEVTGDRFTLGRVTICDRYLLLSGKWNSSRIEGTYDMPYMGGSDKLGYFNLTKIQ